MNDREALRCHIEAVWAIQVPPLDVGDVTLAPNHPLPPWAIYQGQIGQDQIIVWRSPTASAERRHLLAQAQQAIAAPTTFMAMRREVILLPPMLDQVLLAAPLARLLTLQDVALIEAFELGSATALLSQACAPCIGVIVAGRLVSVAHSSRRTAVVCELGIDTLAAARQRGYALAATRLWTATVQQQGLLPIYSVMADNTASRRLAVAAGYMLLAWGVYGPMPVGQDE